MVYLYLTFFFIFVLLFPRDMHWTLGHFRVLRLDPLRNVSVRPNIAFGSIAQSKRAGVRDFHKSVPHDQVTTSVRVKSGGRDHIMLLPRARCEHNLWLLGNSSFSASLFRTKFDRCD